MPWDKPNTDQDETHAPQTEKIDLPKHDYGGTDRCRACGKSIYAGPKHMNKCTGAPGVRKVEGFKR